MRCKPCGSDAVIEVANLDELNTILVVTHNPEIAQAARRVIRLRDGCVEHDSEAG